MEKMKFETEDAAKRRLDAFEALFPNCVTESTGSDGQLRRSVNYERFRQMMGDASAGEREAYEFTWVGKSAAIAEASAPSRSTLRPCVEESRHWDSTKNLYLEGDNLEVLKLLQESYWNSVKMIYIDPPYNTGSDSFVYADNYAAEADAYRRQIGLYDEEGNKRFRENNAANPRFHSDWCSRMYSRLLLARNLLSDDGVLAMSISDAEFHNLKKMADEIFGADHYCGDILWNSTKSVTNTALLSVSHTYTLIYFKDISYFVNHRSEFRVEEDGEGFENPDHDPRGPWKADPFQVGGWRPNQQYEIVNPLTGVVYRPNPGCSWKNDYEKFRQLLAEDRIIFGRSGDGGPLRKRFLSEAKERGKVVRTWWDDTETTANGTQTLKKLFDGRAIFNNPKPVGFLYKLLQLGMNRDGICLDFFSGSATTAHALMKLNAADGGTRSFILVQLKEACPRKSEAFQAGYADICEIGKERIRRAAGFIRREYPEAAFDEGFRVFRLAESNMKDAFYTAGEYDPELLRSLETNIKEDRSELDLLFGCLLEWGFPLSETCTSELTGGMTLYSYSDDKVIACFGESVSEEIVKLIAGRRPARALFLDRSFGGTPAKLRAEELFGLMSPDTIVSVI